MQPLNQKLQQLSTVIDQAWLSLAIDQKLESAKIISNYLAQPSAWDNPVEAQNKSKQLATLEATANPWVEIRAQVNELQELIALNDDSMLKELTAQVEQSESTTNELRKQLRFSGKLDDHNAILRLSAGAGGTDAQDWTEMLQRMYLRWAEKSGMSSEITDSTAGEEAGIKSATIIVNGPYAYGRLRSEHGVHRLVRLSPFNSDNLRQTSFALVEVLPEIDQPDEVVIDEKDLKIDVFRAGGHGGQSVNTTDSAVRITHMPTNIVISIQNERSQLQNKETAMKVLRSKLAQLQLEQHAESLSNLRAGESANFGSQIRNYVLHPYTMVKDARTKHEERDAQGVLDGKLDDFMNAYLEKS